MTSDEVLAWPMMQEEVLLVETLSSIHVASVEVGTKIGNVAAKSDIWQPTFDGNNSQLVDQEWLQDDDDDEVVEKLDVEEEVEVPMEETLNEDKDWLEREG